MLPAPIPISVPMYAVRRTQAPYGWASGDEASAAVAETLRLISERFDIALGADAAGPLATEFLVVVLAERILLTQPARVPGLEVLPVAREAGVNADIPLFNRLLAELGFATVAEVQAWGRHRNLVVLLAKRVLAENARSAIEETVDAGRRLLDLIGLDRGSGAHVLLAGGRASRQQWPTSVLCR